MSMQVASLPMAASVAAQQEPQEKRAPHPSEEKVPVEHSEFLPGTRKPQSPDLKQTALGLEQISLAFNRRLKFIIDQESKEIIIKVIDNETDKVIKVLPPEELQRLHSRIRETIGFLIDRMV